MVGLSGTSYNAYAVGILLILLTGVGTNGCLLFFLFRNKQSRQRVLTPYLVGISAANSTMIVTCLPITFTNAMSHRWLFNDVVCRVEGFIAGTAAISMMLTLACIVYKVHKGMTHILVRNRALYKRSRRPWGLIAGVWLASAVTMLPPLTGVTSMTYEAGQTNCAPNWRPEDTRDIIYAVSLTTIVFIVPMSACIFYLVRIRVTLSRLHVHQSRPRSRFALAYKGITKMVGVSVAMYVVTWMPYCVCVFVSLCGGASLLRSPSVTFIPHLIAKSSFLWMPIIYFLLYNRGLRIFRRRHRVLPHVNHAKQATNSTNSENPFKHNSRKYASNLRWLGQQETPTPQARWIYQEELCTGPETIPGPEMIPKSTPTDPGTRNDTEESPKSTPRKCGNGQRESRRSTSNS